MRIIITNQNHSILAFLNEFLKMESWINIINHINRQ